jgi:hypothetical protein
MIKQALLVGCGSKFGLQLLTQLLAQGWRIYSISGSDINIDNPNLIHLKVNWKTLRITDIEKFLRTLPNLDLVFFNQNSSALSQRIFTELETLELWTLEKNWAQAHFVSCILPLHIIQTLKQRCNKNTKVAYMLSCYAYSNPRELKELGFADYIANKYQNYIIMKNLSLNHPAYFFGINPEKLQELTDDVKLLELTTFIDGDKDINGKVFYLDGSEDTNFNIINNI